VEYLMRIDPDTCRDAGLLAAEVRRLQAVIAASEPTLTDAERNAVARSAATARSNAGACAMSTMNELANTYISDAETLLALLERLG
jgi:hypothetical protein